MFRIEVRPIMLIAIVDMTTFETKRKYRVPAVPTIVLCSSLAVTERILA